MNARTGIKMDFSCFWGYIIAVKKPQQRVWLQAIGGKIISLKFI
jgi:hypothetical protein